MSKRLQVLLEEAELKEIRRAARRQRLTTAAWVRQALRAARRSEPGVDAKKKLAVVRAATLHDFPDIDEMLAEIERGYIAARVDLRGLQHPHVPGGESTPAQG